MSSGFSGPRYAWTISRHAARRMIERGLSEADVDIIIRNGEMIRVEEDRSLYTLPDSPFAVLDPNGDRARLRGTSVVLAPDETVVTVYRNDERCPYRTGQPA